MDDQSCAIDLLTGFDDEEAHEIALMIHEKHEERKESSVSIYEEQETMGFLEEEVGLGQGRLESWGVLGIVAGFILEIGTDSHCS